MTPGYLRMRVHRSEFRKHAVRTAMESITAGASDLPFAVYACGNWFIKTVIARKPEVANRSSATNINFAGGRITCPIDVSASRSATHSNKETHHE